MTRVQAMCGGPPATGRYERGARKRARFFGFHFGPWKAEPVSSYQSGQISQYTATVYIGSTYDEPLPTAFLDDVYNSTVPVIWVYDNIWELTNRFAAFQAKYGWNWWQFEFYYHPFRGVTALQQIVDGLRARGWTFTSPTQLAGIN